MYGEFPATKIMAELEKDSLLPAILFRTARKQCDMDVERLARSRVGRLKKNDQQKLEATLKGIIDKYGFQEELILAHPHYQALIQTGAGAHHAGQLLIWRLILEELMSAGVLKMLIATGTVAAGVDFPARSVVITAHSKRGSDGFKVLSPSEFQQMSGRAGRRGKDSVGVCVIAPTPFCDARIIHRVASQPPEPLRSAYFAAPSTVLNLLKFRSVDDLKFTVQKSLGAFLDRKSASELRSQAAALEQRLKEDDSLSERDRKLMSKRARRMLREAAALELRQEHYLEQSLRGLERLGHIENGKLTEKGSWAAHLCTTLVLELAEAIDDGLFDDLGVETVAALVASIAADPHRTYYSLQENPVTPEQLAELQRIVERVAALYQRPNDVVVSVVPDAATTVVLWIHSENWNEYAAYLRLAGVAEGDAARLISQTADHLNQISRLTETHPELAYTAAEARRLLMKPPLTEVIAIAD
ncbi:MAG: hypothetical protein D6719_01990 [Candidatus Dadabacteria bacterium]|nr:MAG: hypothetical protein D6719_01990 [Candidatus Dadabacteria bacterium]